MIELRTISTPKTNYLDLVIIKRLDDRCLFTFLPPDIMNTLCTFFTYLAFAATLSSFYHTGNTNPNPYLKSMNSDPQPSSVSILVSSMVYRKSWPLIVSVFVLIHQLENHFQSFLIVLLLVGPDQIVFINLFFCQNV